MTPLQPRFLRKHRGIARRGDPSRLQDLGNRAPAPVLAAPAGLIPVWSFQARPAEDFFSEMWSPGLLDRLQAPLSRYHE